jgi:uncharacterized protein involved in outer membrane biogenesis
MKRSNFSRWILYPVGGLVAILLVILLVLAFVRISVDLSRYRGLVETAATRALGRTVKIDGNIIITTSLQPIFSLEGLRIGNPETFEPGDFLRMKTTRIQVRVLPLLLWKIKISEFSVKGLSVMLVQNQSGAVNWAAGTSADESPPEPSPQEKKPGEESSIEMGSDSFVLTRLLFEDITIAYLNPGMKEPSQFSIERCTGRMPAGEVFTLAMNGQLLKEPYSTVVEIGSLQEFLEENRSWMEIKADIAETHFEFIGVIDLSQALNNLQLEASVKGARLDSLSDLLNLDLPPFKTYSSHALLTMDRNKFDLSDFKVQVGKSKLVGKMSYDRSDSRHKSIIELNAQLIQLNDFDLGDWSAEKTTSKRDEHQDSTEEKAADESTQEQQKPLGTDNSVVNQNTLALLSPEVLNQLDVQLAVKAEKVMSGNDDLGSGILTATLKDGRFTLEPVKLNLPGGSFSLTASLKPDPAAPDASIRAVIENFDFGVMVRRVNPESKMGGTISLDLDLNSTATSFEELMAKGNGHFDFSGHLENLKAGIIDLWAVNLLAAIVSKKDENESTINCVIGYWTMLDGVLTPDVLVIDTTEIRICGKGSIDFGEQQISLTVAPTPKRPEFFSLATPIKVQGSFENFGLGIQSGGLAGTVVKFVTSPVHVPIRRIAKGALPADGSDVCGMLIGPEGRSSEPPAGCK